MDQISEWVDIKNKLNVTKIEDAAMGVSPQTGPPKVELFNLLSSIHEIFGQNRYKGKIKFDKILEYQNQGPPKSGADKVQTF